ncbi:MAG: hypothetical protein ACE5Q6_18170 [Dehalococcoidia bacterium]
MAKLQVLNPQAATAIPSEALATRVSDLAGKTIGLYWNMKAGGDVALEETAHLLGEGFPGTKFRSFVGSVGATMRHATAEDAERVARECDAVVGTTGD